MSQKALMVLEHHRLAINLEMMGFAVFVSVNSISGRRPERRSRRQIFS
jgi:hypothetical protein